MKILVHHHKYGDAYYDATDELCCEEIRCPACVKKMRRKRK